MELIPEILTRCLVSYPVVILKKGLKNIFHACANMLSLLFTSYKMKQKKTKKTVLSLSPSASPERQSAFPLLS